MSEELFQTTIELCELSYDPDTSRLKEYSFLKGYEEFPVLIYSSGNILYITIRGTNNDLSSLSSASNSISNIITDISTTDPVGVSNFVKYYKVYQEHIKSPATRLKAHSGFLSSLSRMYNAIYDVVQSYKGRVGKLILSGHSAGGAIVSLFYYLYQNDTRMDKQSLPIDNVITYGSPRFIYDGEDNIDLFNKSCPNLTRVFNLSDIVPYLPFSKALLFNDNITTGFKHVGKAFCLDSNVDFNSLNALSIDVIRKAQKSIVEILPKENYDESIKFIYSDKYLNLLTNGLFQSFAKFYTEEETTEAMIVAYTKGLMEKCEKESTYGGKCDLLKEMDLTDLLKESPIGETIEQENLTIAGIGSALLGFNKISIEAHGFPKYNENLNKLIDQQRIEKKSLEDVDPFERDTQNDYKTTLQGVDTSLMFNKLLETIEEEIANGTIVGVVEDSVDNSGSIIIYDDINDGTN